MVSEFRNRLNAIINKRSKAAVSNNKSYFLMGIGIMFVAFPAILMAVSEKYQVLPMGVGYQVIIYQYYGWGCIGTVVIVNAWSCFSAKFKNAEKKLIVFDGLLMLITVLNGFSLEKQPCYALNSGSGWVIAGAVSGWNSQTSSVMADQIWLYCDDEFDRLLVPSPDGLDFFNLKDADEVTHCTTGNIYSIKDKYYDINQLVPIKYCKYKLGTRFPVSVNRQDIGAYFYGGISDREGGFTWTSDKAMGMYFDLEDTDYENIRVEINVKMIYGGRQPVNIHVNGVCVYSDVLSGKSKIEFECIKPQNGILDMHFDFPEARSPWETGESDDFRKLSLAMDDMILEGF